MGRKINIFNDRQTMNTGEYEVFHYKDARPGGIMLHNHDFYEIYLLLGGEVEYQIENITYPLSRGDMLLVSPMELHRPITRREGAVYERIVLWVDRRHLRILKQIHGLDFEHCLDPGRARHSNLMHLGRENLSLLLGLMNLMLREEEDKQYGSELMRSSFLLQVLILVVRLSQGQPRLSESLTSDSLVDQVFDYINRNITQDLSLDRLSGLMYMSSGTLSRRFKKQLGTSIPEYVRHKRLTMARNMLLEGERPTAVALKCGYADYSSFFRAFKARYRSSPREFVKTLDRSADVVHVS